MNQEKLIQTALEYMNNSYSPYSKFKVGAALLLKDGTIIGGTNIENASYGLSNCAERSALFTAFSQGHRKDDIVMMAVTSTSTPPASPCGACRQVISELVNENVPVIIVNDKGERFETTVKDLLPFAFSKDRL